MGGAWHPGARPETCFKVGRMLPIVGLVARAAPRGVLDASPAQAECRPTTSHCGALALPLSFLLERVVPPLHPIALPRPLHCVMTQQQSRSGSTLQWQLRILAGIARMLCCGDERQKARWRTQTRYKLWQTWVLVPRILINRQERKTSPPVALVTQTSMVAACSAWARPCSATGAHRSPSSAGTQRRAVLQKLPQPRG